MNNLKTLVLMQLKDKVDFSYLKSTKKTIFKVILSILKFGIITGLIYFGFLMISYFQLVASYAGIPQNFFTVIFTIMYSLSIITCSFGLMKSLYQGRDNQLLLTFPAKRTMVFTSKLIVYYIYELLRNITYMLPIFVAYGIINHLPIYFYFWLIAIYFVLVAIPVVLGALLSIPTMYVVNFIKQHKWLEYIILAGAVALIVWALLSIIKAIPNNIDIFGTWGTTFWKIQDFLEKFVEKFSIFYYVVVAVTGIRDWVIIKMFVLPQVISVLVMLAIVVVVVAITYLIVRPLYFHMASSPFEYKKKQIRREHKNRVHNSFFSAIKKDFIINYRTQEKFYGLLGVTIGLPIAILLLNKLYSAMDTRLTGTNMTIGFNVLMILLIAMSSSVNMAHVYSEEGASNYLLKTSPKAYLQSLFVKLMPNIMFITTAIISSVVIMSKFLEYSFGQSIAIFLILEGTYIAHMLMSEELDIMNPQTQQYQTAGMHHNNPNDLKSTLYSFLLSVFVAFLVYFLITENPLTAWWKVVFVVMGFLALRIWLYVNKIKVYFKEKQ